MTKTQGRIQVYDMHSLLVCVHAGQVMLVWPHQMYLTGITAGVILMVASGWFNIWSMWILVIFYMERKNKMVRGHT